MRSLLLFCFFAAIILGSSCAPRRTLPNNYLQNINDSTGKDTFSMPDPLIQKSDLLSIQVYSASIIPEADAPYNLPNQGSANVATSGFLVDARGNIEFPRLGTIRAEGLTKSQLTEVIRRKLEGQLSQPSVVIRFINYKVSVLGEVGSPGTFTIPTERITVLEALGLAGDITEFGKKQEVRVLRETNGQRMTGTVDLTSKNMFESPFYYLQQNDVVFVEQSVERGRQRDQQALVTQISIATSVLTSIALILNLFTRNN
jgi:polysaccharide export outer membrane protein